MAVLMEAFPRRGGDLRCGGLGVQEVAGRFGTPLYIYDASVVDDRVRAFQEAFREVDFLLAYSVKANGNLALLNRVGRLGAGADIVSGGELYRALEAGIPADRIVFAGVGKRAPEMEAALEAGIRAFHVESRAELVLLEGVARDAGTPAPVSVRLNPDVHAPTPHSYTRTGHASSKFGVPVEEAMELYRRARESDALTVRGVDVHIGSQIDEVEPYEQALDAALEMLGALRDEGIEPEYVDLGGGFAVPEGPDRDGFDLEGFADVVVPRIREAGVQLVLEPGRSVVGEAGILVTRVLHVKEQGGKTFVVTDGGMTDLLRPSHYGGYHEIEPVTSHPERIVDEVDVVGPICETGDFLGQDRELALPHPGDLLAVRNAGAYGFVMAMHYNGRPRPAEVLVEGDAAVLIRSRETYADLIRGEFIPVYDAEGAGGVEDDGDPGAEAPTESASAAEEP